MALRIVQLVDTEFEINRGKNKFFLKKFHLNMFLISLLILQFKFCKYLTLHSSKMKCLRFLCFIKSYRFAKLLKNIAPNLKWCG